MRNKKTTGVAGGKAELERQVRARGDRLEEGLVKHLRMLDFTVSVVRSYRRALELARLSQVKSPGKQTPRQ